MKKRRGLIMDIPMLPHVRLQTLGITQPVAGSSAVGAIAPESRSADNLKKEAKGGFRHPREDEEDVDISELARLLSRGVNVKTGRR
ncbi:MAG TPA: hypothetical protein VF799_11910 [Geobacteraceae bacterium]